MKDYKYKIKRLIRITIKNSLWVWMLAIFVQSSFPAITGGPPSFPHFDKVMHFLIYAILGGLTVLRFSGFYFPFILGSAFGLSDEIHQLFVPSRSFDLLDLAADIVGVIAGILVTRFIIRKINK